MTTAQGHLSVRRKSYGKDGKDGIDGAAGKDGANGLILRYCGPFSTSSTYVYNDTYRDIVAYNDTFFIVYKKGTLAAGTTPTTSLSDGDNDGNWQKYSTYKGAIAADTALFNGANIAGFSFSKIDTDSNGMPRGLLASQNGKFSMNASTGILYSEEGQFKRATITDGTFKVTSGVTTVELSTASQGMKISEGETEKTSFTATEKTKDSLYQTEVSGGLIEVNNTYSFQAIDLYSGSSGLIYPTRQGTMMGSVNLLENSTISTFTIKSKSRVQFGDGSTNFLSMNFTIPSGIEASQFYSCVEVEITDSTSNARYYYQDYYTNYNTGENDGATSVNISSFYVTLDAGTYKMAVHSTMFANVQDKLTSDGRLFVNLSNIPWSADPQIYHSDFFGNGLAIGTSANHHFLTINENDIQTSEMISGDAGIKVSGGVLKLKIKGKWYSLGVSGSAIMLTETSE
jgi:hypothetical protein